MRSVTEQAPLAFVFQEWTLLPQRQEAAVGELEETASTSAPSSAIQRLVPKIMNQIFEARVRQRWTVQELAVRVGVSVDDILKYESGEAFPRADAIQNLQAALDISLIPPTD